MASIAFASALIQKICPFSIREIRINSGEFVPIKKGFEISPKAFTD